MSENPKMGQRLVDWFCNAYLGIGREWHLSFQSNLGNSRRSIIVQTCNLWNLKKFNLWRSAKVFRILQDKPALNKRYALLNSRRHAKRLKISTGESVWEINVLTSGKFRLSHLNFSLLFIVILLYNASAYLVSLLLKNLSGVWQI